MRWRGPLPAQSNYQLGILAAKHALNQPGESQSRCRLPEAAVMSRLVARCCRVDWGRRGVARHRCCRDEGMSRRRVLDLHPVAAAPLGARFMRPASHRPLTILPILHPTSTIPGPKLWTCTCSPRDASSSFCFSQRQISSQRRNSLKDLRVFTCASPLHTPSPLPSTHGSSALEAPCVTAGYRYHYRYHYRNQEPCLSRGMWGNGFRQLVETLPKRKCRCASQDETFRY